MSRSAPAQTSMPVTPSDSADLPGGTCRAISVKVSGNVKITDASNSTDTIYVTAGYAFPQAAARIWSTGTTATGISAHY